MRNAESFFFPLDVRLRLGTEGYSPAVIEKATRQSAKASSFAEASDDMRELAEIEISATHLQRLSERIGEEWIEIRDEDVEAFRKGTLERTYKESLKGAAAVMLDGGRLQTRAQDSGRGVFEEGWRESKVACCLTLNTKASGEDPQPEPPTKFLEPSEAARLAGEIKSRRTASSKRNETGQTDEAANDKTGQRSKDRAKDRTKRRARKSAKRGKGKAKRTRVRTVVATMANSETFGWQVAAEVHRRGLDLTKRKACVCDGQAYNWSVYEMHLVPLGFIAILDFVHLLAYLYDAAQAWRGSNSASAWSTYEQWLRWAWSGKVGSVLNGLRAAIADVKAQGSRAKDRLQTLTEALTYITNNSKRMDYPEYRRLGLPISSAPVESTIKQINRRVKGTEKFWLEGGAEAILQLRAAQLSDDGRWTTAWSRPRKHRRAAGAGRLGQAA